MAYHLHGMREPRQAALLIGLFVAALGIAVLAAWMPDITALKNVAPALVTMRPNTAAAMLLCGTALALLSREPVGKPIRLVTGALAAAVIAMGALNLGEELFGWHLGIDQWFFRELTGAVESSSAGQLSPVTALHSVLVGSALLLAAQPIPMSWGLPVIAALGTGTIVVGGLVLVGHVSDVLLHLREWSYDGAAPHTAAGFMLLGCGLLALVRSESGLAWSLDRSTTAGFVVSIMVLLAAEGLSHSLANQLQQETLRVSQTHEVLKEIQDITTGAIDLENSQHGYIIASDERLEQRGNTKAAIEEHLETVRRLTADDPNQQRRLDQLAPLIVQLTEFGEQILEARRQQGYPGAEHVLATNRGIVIANGIRQLAREMADEEDRLLDQRQNQSSASFTKTLLLTPLGAFLNVVIMSLGLFVLNARTGDRVRAEAALREERARLAGLIDSAMDAIITVDSAQNIMLLNSTAERMFGVTAASVVGGSLAPLIPERFRTPHAAHIQGFGHTATSARRMGRLGHVTGLRANGDEFPIETSISQAEVNGRKFYTAIMRDVSEHWRERMFTDAMIESMPGIFYFYNEQGKFLRWNRNFVSVSGYSADEIARMHPSELFRGEDKQLLTQAMSEALDKGESSVEADFVSKNGRATPYFFTGRRLVFDGSICLVGTGIDITVRRQIEATRGRLAAIVEFSDDAIIGKDTNGIVTSWNQSAERLFGYPADEMMGQPITRLLPPDRRQEEEQILDRIRGGENVEHLETVRKKKNGQLIDVSITVSPIRDTAYKIVGASKIARDITGTKRLAQQLRQSQKMEAIGQLTGGVAHDFNNLLGVILGNLDLVERIVAKDETASNRVRIAQKAAMRGAALTKRLLAFSRRQPLHPAPTSLDESIQNLLDMAARALGPEINIVTNLDSSIPPVFVDAAGLDNVLLNLAVNARDAMPQGGSLTISTKLSELEESYLLVQSGELKPGRYACIRVSDTGHGMARETLERAFEPFFTTKPRGKGTGLGLAMVYGFIKQSGGNVRIYSEPGIGTTVSLYLPFANGSPASARAGVSIKGMQAKPDGTVLVVDDEVDLLEIAVVYLEDMGYKVFHATDGPRALEIIAREPGIDLLVTDVIMPGGMNGVELANKVRQLKPGVKIVYSSGFASDRLAERSGKRIDGPLMYKPYQRNEFVAIIRRAMEGNDAGYTAHHEIST